MCFAVFVLQLLSNFRHVYRSDQQFWSSNSVRYYAADFKTQENFFHAWMSPITLYINFISNIPDYYIRWYIDDLIKRSTIAISNEHDKVWNSIFFSTEFDIHRNHVLIVTTINEVVFNQHYCQGGFSSYNYQPFL